MCSESLTDSNQYDASHLHVFSHLLTTPGSSLYQSKEYFSSFPHNMSPQLTKNNTNLVSGGSFAARFILFEKTE